MTVYVNPMSDIESAFREFHADHPEVYDELVRLARELQSRGYDRFGIATIYEVARWRSMLRSADQHGFKLNNNYRSHYARMISQREPDLRGIFKTRRLGVPSHVV